MTDGFYEQLGTSRTRQRDFNVEQPTVEAEIPR